MNGAQIVAVQWVGMAAVIENILRTRLDVQLIHFKLLPSCIGLFTFVSVATGKMSREFVKVRLVTMSVFNKRTTCKRGANVPRRA